MVVATRGLDSAARGVVVLTNPLSGQDEVAGDVLKPFEQVRECLAGRFLEREDFDVPVVETEVVAVALQGLVTSKVVEEDIVLEPYAARLVRCVVEESPKEDKGFVLVEEASLDQVTKLNQEAGDSVGEDRPEPKASRNDPSGCRTSRTRFSPTPRASGEFWYRTTMYVSTE